MSRDPITTWRPQDAPVLAMLLGGEAETVHEAEERYLDAHLEDVVALLDSLLADLEFRSHPLIQLLFAHGSRDWEDALT